MNLLAQLFSPLGAFILLLLSFVYPLIVMCQPQVGDCMNRRFSKVCIKVKSLSFFTSEEREYFNVIYTVLFVIFLIIWAISISLNSVGLSGDLLLVTFLILVIILFLREGTSLSIKEVLKSLWYKVPHVIAVVLVYTFLDKELKILSRGLTMMLTLGACFLIIWKQILSLSKIAAAHIVNLLFKGLFFLCNFICKDKPFDAFIWLVGAATICPLLKEIAK